MYCLKCRCVTETKNIATAASTNGRLMRRDQCVICRKIRLNSSKEMLPVEAIHNSLVNKLPFEMHLPGYIFTGPGTKPVKD